MTPRVCDFDGCPAKLASHNQSGFCKSHNNVVTKYEARHGKPHPRRYIYKKKRQRKYQEKLQTTGFPTAPLRDLIKQRQLEIAHVCRQAGVKEKWIYKETVSLFAADAICAELGTHVDVVPGVEVA